MQQSRDVDLPSFEDIRAVRCLDQREFQTKDKRTLLKMLSLNKYIHQNPEIYWALCPQVFVLENRLKSERDRGLRFRRGFSSIALMTVESPGIVLHRSPKCNATKT
jgi:hypothetical protein